MAIGIKKGVSYAAILVLLIGILALLSPSLTAKAQLGQSVTYGVYPGDTFTYGRPDGSQWVQMYPSSVPPRAEWNQFVNVSTLTFRILNDSKNALGNPTYAINVTEIFRNGTAPLSKVATIDLSDGSGTAATFFIPPGLENDSYIYPGAAQPPGNYTWRINATRIDNLYWPGVPVCELNSTTYTPYVNSSSPLIAQRTTFVWDQRTGVLLGAYEGAYAVEQSTQNALEGVVLYELIANNINIPMNYPGSFDMVPVYVALVVGVVIIIGIVIVRVTGRKSKSKYKGLKNRTKSIESRTSASSAARTRR